MKESQKFIRKSLIAGIATMSVCVFGIGAAQAADVVSAKDIAGDGARPCAEAIQRLIDANPNREIFFPDGTYLLDRPICTPSAS